MSCTKNNCPIKGKPAGSWACSCEPLDQSDKALLDIVDQVAKNTKKPGKK